MITNIIEITVVLIVVFYFLRKQKKTEDKYFGREDKLTNTEIKILDFHKRNYKPIPKDSRFLTIETNGVELQDVAKNATEFIYDFPIPTSEEISKLEIGDFVKLIFEDSEGYAERMWVEIKQIVNNIFCGSLRNDSFQLEGVKYDTEIFFHANNILEIEKETKI